MQYPKTIPTKAFQHFRRVPIKGILKIIKTGEHDNTPVADVLRRIKSRCNTYLKYLDKQEESSHAN